MSSKETQNSAYEVGSNSPAGLHHGDVPVPPQDQPYGKPNLPVRLREYAHILDPWTIFKWEHPHFYRKPGFGYQKLASYRHRDVFDRIWIGDYDDRYISSWDGKISKLVVQAVDDIYDNNTGSTYRRTFIRNSAPIFLRLANWPFNHINYAKHNGPTSEDFPMLCLKWFIASCAITLVISTPIAAQPEARNNGGYDPVPYQYFGYPKVARNILEMDRPLGRDSIQTNAIAERVLRPRYLCFLRDKGQPAKITKVEEWITENPGRNLSYVFIAYTAEQFESTEDLLALHRIADAAARNAGVLAYWVGCSCMPERDEMQEDVYRICDVIRGAHSLAIAIGRPANDGKDINVADILLQQWGKRVWTFPEILLSPAGKEVKVYMRGGDLTLPIRVAKNQFAAQVWKDDALVARQLIDHYEGNMILSQLELVTLALECLHKRETAQYLPGDHSYALMGLLRIRPKIDPTDSAFQAFARLSLANGSDQLLERLICVLPKTPDQPWHSMDDAYDAKLWDILPQDVGIAGVGEDDTIILDGCRAANIRWKSFTPVAHTRRLSWRRLLAQIALRLTTIVFIVALVLLGIPSTKIIGIGLIIYTLALMALSPWLLRLLYLGKFWEQQCWFFGFEGYMDLDTIETQIFGARLGRMKWTAAASPLSRHRRNEQGECVGFDPTEDEAVRELVERAKGAGPGDMRVFTLVDTGNMTATIFQAARPPTAFLMTASEGGMKRLLGCSYAWETSTFYRETVLRIGTEFEDKMARIGRVKLGFRRGKMQVAEENEWYS
ncbi:hypothetical protein IAQ61_001968 [Plenodomus lingam]|uniref:uncharacterized protein n=1 Tax=Leptosphaeria maculans TaxID=5022 RepID=UPI003332970E|nr:hypothetical protein IAQ61_001968 [Plenodomus lingam]